ncbi:hypothetical protein FACS1894166_02850 [Bacilli bacterium]|nr:hypothetical protein FACS1894166_02850 [Bacilli bacterium]
MLELTLGRFIKEDKAEIDITIDNAYQLTKQLFPSRTNNKYFYNCSKGKKEFNISIKDIVVSEDLGNEIIDTIYKTHDLIPDIPTSDPDEEQTYGVKVKGAIEAVVISLANKYHYENRGIFTFISELLIRITNVHAFHNGNKRTAIVSISRILETFGYYLIWSQSSKAYILY